MKLSRLMSAFVWLVIAACELGPTQGAPPPDVPFASPEVPSGDPDLAFPGGGRILYVSSEGPGYDWGGIGFVEANGTFHRIPGGGYLTFPYWDPSAPDRVLTLSNGSRPETRSYEIDGDSVDLVGSWRTSELMTWPSPDGRTIAYTPVDRSGHHVRTDILRLVDRPTGNVSTIRSGGLVPEGWTPDGKLLAYPWSGGDRVIWDPWTGTKTPFGPGNLSSVSWAPDGSRFSAVIARGGPNPRSAIVIGDPVGEVTDRLHVGPRWVEMPTWSPDGTQIAFIVRGLGRSGHRSASLHVYDVDRQVDSVVAHPVSDAFWAPWSPDGDWLLVADWTRNRWLFVAADGSERRPYPWLGDFPRWCCPSSPAWVRVPAS
jgi:WD40 repeat protein